MLKRLDITGQRSGLLTADHEIEPWILPDGRKQRRYECICDCGNTCNVRVNDFRSGKSTSCGCKRNQSNHNRMFEDLTGQTFNRLTVIKRVEDHIQKSGDKKVSWLCKCQCGNYCVTTSTSLKSGNTKSCGCFKSEQIHKRCMIDLAGLTFGHLFVLSYSHTKNKFTYFNCLCDCGNTCVVSSNCLRMDKTHSCGHISSMMEDAVNTYLINNHYEFIIHQCFSDLIYYNYLSFDFGIYNNGKLIGLIECQGRQHYDDVGSFGKLQREITDPIKKDYCEKNNIPLYEIRYDDNTIEKLKSILNDLHANPVPSLIDDKEG